MPASQYLYGILSVLGLAAQLAQGQLTSDCNPMLTDKCPPKKGWPASNYYIDFTKTTSLPSNWIMADYEVVNFNSKGAEFSFIHKGDAPNLWTDFYMLGGRYDVVMKIAPGVGVISSAVLWGDTLDEIDWEFSGNQFGNTPFPSADGMHVIQTNIFGQSQSWDGAATFKPWVHKPYEEFHTYSVEWDFDFIRWFVDGKVMREVRAKDIPSYSKMPQGPMKLQLGVWDGGDPDNSYWTKKWAGGETDLKGGPYTAYVRSVNITNKYPACQYKYNGKSGLRNSIQIIKDGCQVPPTTDAKKPAASSSPALPASSAPAVSLPNFQREVGSGGYAVSPAPSGGAPPAPASSHPPSSPPPPASSAVPTSQAPALGPSTHASSSPPASSAPAPPEAKGSSAVPAAGQSYAASGIPGSSAAPQSTHLSSSAAVAASSYAASGLPSSSPAGSSYAASGIPSSAVVSAPSTLVTSSVVASSSSHALSSGAASGIVSSSASLGGSSGGVSSSGGPSTSTGGILSSLSSLILGTSSSSIVSAGSLSYAASSASIGGTVTGSSSGSAAVTSSHSGSSLSASSGYSVVSQSASSGPQSSPATASHSGSASASASVSESGSSQTMSSAASGSSSAAAASLITTSSISTIYSTNIYTITSCAPEVKNCPGKGAVTTELVSIATTVCPVTLTPGKAAASVSASAPLATQSSLSLSSSAMSRLVSGSSALSSVAASASESMSSAISSFSSSVGAISSSSSLYPSGSSAAAAASLSSSSAAAPPPSQTMPSTYSVSSQVITSSISTIYSTNIYTVTSCAPEVKNCPAKGEVTTELVSLYTTICPVTNKILDGITYPQVNAIAAAPPTSPPVVSASSSAPGMPPSSSSSSPVITSGSMPMSSSSVPSSSGSSLEKALPSAARGSSAPSSPPPMTTSTVFTSSVYTVSSCAPGAAECSSMMGSVTTEQVALYTTVCPVKESSKPPPPPGVAPVLSSGVAAQSGSAAPGISPVVGAAPYANASMPGPMASASQPSAAVVASQPPLFTTSTVFQTNVYTVTSCGPEVTNCPAKLGAVTTEIIALSTTVCPVTQSAVAPVAAPGAAKSDVPSYQYSAAESTAAMGSAPGAPMVSSPPSSLPPSTSPVAEAPAANPALTRLTVVPAGNSNPQNAPKEAPPPVSSGPAPAPGQDTEYLTKTMTNRLSIRPRGVDDGTSGPGPQGRRGTCTIASARRRSPRCPGPGRCPRRTGLPGGLRAHDRLRDGYGGAGHRDGRAAVPDERRRGLGHDRQRDRHAATGHGKYVCCDDDDAHFGRGWWR
ncbi:extracellular cell wall glucanase Crf1/allergen Asp F9 [Apiospora marii]|uniref:Extracellular cell wall glucanase Crf1/allergen Asp F9 n=1 Tax=Apiospora marii TaxID=335849 RepID=A0ABR1S5Z4_9PEZI